MNKPIFSDVAQIEIEGNQALRCVERKKGETVYEIRGFDAPIFLQDFRPKSNPTLFEDYDEKTISKPALVTIQSQPNESLVIQLHPTRKRTSKYTLWIAVGLDEFIPQHDCIYDQIDFLDDNKLAFLGVLKRPRRKKKQQEDWSFLSV